MSDQQQIGIETDAAASLSQQWRAWGEQVAARGASPRVEPSALDQRLGPIYGVFVKAKADEQTARQRAYQRVAEHAFAHADKLDNVSNTFTSEDDRSAARIAATGSGD